MIAAIHWEDATVAILLALPAVVAAWFAYMTHENVQTPSGDTLGAAGREGEEGMMRQGSTKPSPRRQGWWRRD